MDREGIINNFNPAAEDMFGYTSDEAIGLDGAMLFMSPSKTRHVGNWLLRLIPSDTGDISDAA